MKPPPPPRAPPPPRIPVATPPVVAQMPSAARARAPITMGSVGFETGSESTEPGLGATV
jgi:hypothetical protein